MVLHSHLFKNFPQFAVNTQSGFKEVAIDVFLELPCFLHDPVNVVNLISSSVFSESSLYIWNFSVHILLKPSVKDFEHNLTSM